MVVALFHKFALSGLAAAIAAGAGAVNTLADTQRPAYGAPVTILEAAAAARHAAHVFGRADLNKDGALDGDEFSVLAIVTAELARLNGFVAVDLVGGAKTVAVPGTFLPALTRSERALINDRAIREFAVVAGADERLGRDEFVSAEIEIFLASDADRNGLLAGGELTSFARTQASLATITS